jgi:hypothetical protein
MKPAGGFTYRARSAISILGPGLAEYAVAVYDGADVRTFPGGVKGDPGRWDFTGRDLWRAPVVEPHAPIVLFDAARDLDHVLYPTRGFRTDIVPGSEPGTLALSVLTFWGTPRQPFAIRTFLPKVQWTRFAPHGAGPTAPPWIQVATAVLRIRARRPHEGSTTDDAWEIALVERDGTAWSAPLALTTQWQEFTIPVEDLRRRSLALLPGGYPLFLPSVLEPDVQGVPRTSAVYWTLDGLQFTVREKRTRSSDVGFQRGFEIERVILEPGY